MRPCTGTVRFCLSIQLFLTTLKKRLEIFPAPGIPGPFRLASVLSHSFARALLVYGFLLVPSPP